MLKRKLFPLMGLLVFFSACKKETAEVSAPPRNFNGKATGKD
jgi:hypothetical protein